MHANNRLVDMENTEATTEKNLYIALVRPDGEKFLFCYEQIDEETEFNILRTLCTMADDPESSFSWRDAGSVAKMLKELSRKHREKMHQMHIMEQC